MKAGAYLELLWKYPEWTAPKCLKWTFYDFPPDEATHFEFAMLESLFQAVVRLAIQFFAGNHTWLQEIGKIATNTLRPKLVMQKKRTG